jgi:hypothetical protein
MVILKIKFSLDKLAMNLRTKDILLLYNNMNFLGSSNVITPCCEGLQRSTASFFRGQR